MEKVVEPTTQHQKLDKIMEGQKMLLESKVREGEIQAQIGVILTGIGENKKEIVKGQIEVNEQVTNQGETLLRIEKALADQSKRIIWLEWLIRPTVVLLFSFAILLALQSDGCSGKHRENRPRPTPSPKPVDDKIVCTSQAEMNVILSALRIVEREQQQNPQRDLYDAITALSHLFGDGKDGVKQETQDKIFVELTGGRELLESIAQVREKLTVK